MPPTVVLPEPMVTSEAIEGGVGVGDGEGVAVGDGDGDGDGEGLLVGVGDGDGVGEGLAVGEGEGPVVGDGDGDSEGVGDSVGPAVGDAEGEGLAVGDGEGDGEGVGDGLAVGEGDGVGDGVGEGLAVGDGDGEGDGAGNPVIKPLTGTAPDTLPSITSASVIIVRVRVASPSASTCQVTAATLMVGPAAPLVEKEFMLSCPVLLADEIELEVGGPAKAPSPPATKVTFTLVLSKLILRS